MIATAPEALRYVEIIAGFTAVFSSLEFLTLAREFGKDGFYGFPPARRRTAFILVSLRLLMGALLVMGPGAALRPAALLSALLLGRVVYGMFAAGVEAADQMLAIVLGALFLASLAPGDATVQTVAVWFIALQSISSYLLAGVTKVLIPAWRDGSFLSSLLRTEMYGNPVLAQYVSGPRLPKLFSAFILTAECSAPLGLVTGGSGAVVFCCLGGAFHLVNAYFLGLNMFVWSFAATYPAIVYCAEQLYR